MFDTSDYLKRLKITPPVVLGAGWLADLHLAHLRNIPYENFDIINGLPFDLDEQHLFNKIIRNNRGGFCYELNILFARLLKELGFNVHLLSAQIIAEDSSIGPEFDHPLIMVQLTEKWLLDVGNVKWFIQPLSLSNPGIQNQFGYAYSISCENGLYCMNQLSNGQSISQYQFRIEPVHATDFIDTCHHKWTSADSKFTKGYICSKFLEQERVVIKNHEACISSGKQKAQQAINNKGEFAAQIKTYFGTGYQKLIEYYY